MKCRRATSEVTTLVKRTMASSSSSGPTVVTGPTAKLKSWESGARMVKNTKVENQYLDHIRDMHDPSSHLKTIEDELKGTIGESLGKQGQKISSALQLMEQERQRYEEFLENHGANSRVVVESAQQYNVYRKQCIQARWELIVHRQAAGFTVGNHKFIMERFLIGDPLPEDTGFSADTSEESSSTDSSSDSKNKKKFGDQLDWWETVGRWK